MTEINAVRGLWPRGFIDYNRAWPVGINYYADPNRKPQIAVEDENLAIFYEFYHTRIDNIITHVINKFCVSSCLLLDFHGFTAQPPYGEFDLILGTGNRKTIFFNDIDVLLYEFFSQKGYKVFLPREESQGRLEDEYAADFTTRHYAEKFGINAIQVEIHSKFRNREGEESGKKLSKDFAGFFAKIVSQGYRRSCCNYFD